MSWIKETVMDLTNQHQSLNPFKIADNLKINVLLLNLHYEIQGFYRYEQRNKYIVINNNLSEVEQRFVCAHELGHAVLHPRSNTPFLRDSTFFSVDRLEVEANTFAVELLLPDDLIKGYGDTQLTLDNLVRMQGIPKNLAYLKKF
ncbi:ImmA/IrrE family metallo-endopeptidase [Priestia filamentosa]|uniref:ImmA/IrrE family metallo-endopeptidase n=1 Tax=Priestia filamentosa TaxID=1402861 RepID=UPI003981BE5A